MNLRSIILSGFGLLLAGTSFAQDQIHKRNGDVIEGRIRDISNKTITYKVSDDAGAPEYEISRSEVKKIEYEDGTVERFEKDSYKERLEDARPDYVRDRRTWKNKKMHNNMHYGPNILAFAPIQISESGMGVGISYERMLDKKGIVSFYMPVSYTFTGDGGDNYYGYNDELQNLYLMPGIKIYPTGSNGIVKYSIGPSLVFAFGEEYRDDLYYTYSGPYYGGSYYPYYNYGYKGDRFSFGMMINNTLNINPTPHLYLGLELGLGLSYLHYVDNVRQDTQGLTQFGFRVGYRF